MSDLWSQLKADSKIYRTINGEKFRSVLVGPWFILFYALMIILAVFYVGH